MQHNDEYNGWSNRETWLVHLWLTNEERLYNEAREKTSNGVGEFSDWTIDLFTESVSLWTLDMVRASMARVNFREIINSLNEK